MCSFQEIIQFEYSMIDYRYPSSLRGRLLIIGPLIKLNAFSVSWWHMKIYVINMITKNVLLYDTSCVMWLALFSK